MSNLTRFPDAPDASPTDRSAADAELDAIDMSAARSRAFSFYGALSVLDQVDVTGPEFWATFNNPATRPEVFAWVTNARRKLDDIASAYGIVANKGSSS